MRFYKNLSSKLIQSSKPINHHIIENITTGNLKSFQKYCCLLLNLDSSTTSKRDYFDDFKFIWDQADYRIAVDGSANTLAKKNILDTAHVVSGDFDSINPNILKELRNGGSKPRIPKLVGTPDQKNTDFTKALNVSDVLAPDIKNFFAIYYHNGVRQDHMFGLFNTLHKKDNLKKRIYIFNLRSTTLSFLLTPGKHVIKKPPRRDYCSLVPLEGFAKATTRGLDYDLKNTYLSFRGIVSTCNLTRDSTKEIVVETNKNLLWSIQLDNNEFSCLKQKTLKEK